MARKQSPEEVRAFQLDWIKEREELGAGKNGVWQAIQTYVEDELGVTGFASGFTDADTARRRGLLDLLHAYTWAHPNSGDADEIEIWEIGKRIRARRGEPEVIPPSINADWREYVARVRGE